MPRISRTAIRTGFPSPYAQLAESRQRPGDDTVVVSVQDGIIAVRRNSAAGRMIEATTVSKDRFADSYRTLAMERLSS